MKDNKIVNIDYSDIDLSTLDPNANSKELFNKRAIEKIKTRIQKAIDNTTVDVDISDIAFTPDLVFEELKKHSKEK